MSRLIDLTGQKFGRLTVVERAENKGRVRWLCQCDCGGTAIVMATNLRKGHSKSCGCIKDENMREQFKTHGLSKHPLYRRWSNMKDRCYREGTRNYDIYGGRGIRICDEWLNSFQCFYDWSMGSGFSEELQIDRIDNDGNYEPSNCRWTSPAGNSRNRSNSKLTIEQARDIKRRLSIGEHPKSIADSHNVDDCSVYDIRAGRTWKDA